MKVKADDNVTVLASYTYGDSNERLIVDEGGLRTYYACDAKVEYTESGSDTTPGWSKSYVFLGGRLLSTLTPNGSGGEFVQYHHPDRLGTRLASNAQDTTSFEQVTLPFGTALNAESTGATNRRFTSYDRLTTTGLDYAMNRHYDPHQGRFTQVDPIEMASVSIESPQTLNLYAYCANDPVNNIDPSGLGFFSFFKKLFKAIGKIIKILAVVLVVAVVVALTIAYFAPAGSGALSFAKFLLFQFAPAVAESLAQLSGVAMSGITVGPGGTPPWNPSSRSVFGWQDQGPIFTCQRPPDCQNEIPPLPPESVTVAIPRPPWHQRGIFRTAGNFLGGFAEALTEVPFTGWSFVRWYDMRRGTRDVDEDSWSYYVGSISGDVGQTFIPVVGVVGKVKRAGYVVKIGLHTAHHKFGPYGLRSHLQLNVWQKGVKGWKYVRRQRLPFRKWPKRNHSIEF